MSSPMVGPDAVGRAEPDRVVAPIDAPASSPRPVGVAAALPRRARRAGRRPPARVLASGSSSRTGWPAPASEPLRDVREVRGLRASTVVAPFASAPDGPTQTTTGTSRPVDGPDDVVDAGVDRARRLHLEHEHRRPALVRIPDRVADERLVRRVEVALDLHDVDAAPAGAASAASRVATCTRRRPRRTHATRGRRTRRARTEPGAIRTPVASWAMDLERFCSASRVVIVAGKGGVGKTTVTAALAVAAARAGMSVLIVEVEGKSGLAALLRPTRPHLRGGRAAARGAGPAPSRPTTRCSSTSTTTGCGASAGA